LSEPGTSDGASQRPAPRGALAVGAGILASRLAGLGRAAATSAAFGVGPYADVFQTALRAPNVLQNLLGEQALSASFIPVYSRFLARGDEEGARRFAGAVFGLLVAVAGGLALLGVLAARPIVALFAAGYLQDGAAVAAGEATVDRFELAVVAVRWIFPMTGLLVLSAWALGVLNSHRRFFLPYVAPVAWNAAIVAALWMASAGVLDVAGEGAGIGERLLFGACLGALVGGALQLAVQLPAVLRALGGLRPSLSRAVPGVREALAAFAPALAGRGVVQLSSYLDQILASFLVVGAVSALGYAQMLYLLPVSLFGQAIAAAALPELSRTAAGAAGELAPRAKRALADAELLYLPATVALVAFAPIAVAGIYQLLPGRFGAADVALVAAVLATYAVGLPASISSRVLQTSFFALGDTRTPARVAAWRVALGATVAVPAMLLLDRLPVEWLPGFEPAEPSALRLGAVGLALGASVAAWVERAALGRALTVRMQGYESTRPETARRLLAVVVAALPAWGIGELGAAWHPTLRALAAFGCLGAVYLMAAGWLGVAGRDPLSRLLRRR
jgi:putative peptidoglycan lipid II flippase